MTLKQLPIIYTAHHASHNYGAFSERCALNDEQRVRFSDYGTDLTVPRNGTVLIAEYSRGIVDLNRPGDNNSNIFPDQDYARPTRNNIWKVGQEPTEAERVEIEKNIYDTYHASILEAIQLQKAPTLVFAWDNTAQYDIGKNEAGEVQQMKPFILSNRGAEESAYKSVNLHDPVSCDPELLLKIVELFKQKAATYGLPDEVHLNLVMKGGRIASHYSSLRNPDLGEDYPVQSLQMEYSTILTHNQITLEPDQKAIDNIRTCWEEVMSEAYAWWLQQLPGKPCGNNE